MAPTFRTLAAMIALAFVVLTPSQPGAAPQFSDWTVPTNLGPTVNSPFHDFAPAISKDGLSLYFSSLRPAGVGGSDIWVSQRPTTNDEWSSPMNLGAVVNSALNDSVPALSRDGHWLFFNSDRPGGFGLLDIWVSWRAHTHDDFGWGPPFNLGADVNTPFGDVNPSYFENEEGGAPLLYFCSNRGLPPGEIKMYVSQLGPDGRFGPATLIPELSTLPMVLRPSVRFDGLELIFHEGPFNLGLSNLWVSTRERTSDPWSAPVMLGPPVNTDHADQQPYLAADRRTLFLTSDRPEGYGGLDLYVTTRTKAFR